MWILRVLSGKNQGLLYTLSRGFYLLGRKSTCQIHIDSKEVSKIHAKIEVLEDNVYIMDLDSRNGVFVDGKKVKTTKLKAGQNIVIGDVILDLSFKSTSPVPVPDQDMQHWPQAHADDGSNLALKMESFPQEKLEENPQNQEDIVLKGNQGLLHLAKEYLDKALFPGIYKLGEVFDFKWVLFMFIFAFIIFVTAFSAIPLVQILKGSVEQESQKRALTIVKTLSVINSEAVAQGADSSLSVEFALREPGVTAAYILDALDGSVLAPANQNGQYPDQPFIHKARKLGREAVKQVNNDTIVAVHPITVYDAKRGENTPKAYAAVKYDMDSLAVGDDRTISLMIQTFFIALLVGSILFIFMYRFVLYPILDLGGQLNTFLKEGKSQLKNNYNFPELQDFISNINSVLNRVSMQEESSEKVEEKDRTQEMEHLVQLSGYPTMAFRSDTFEIVSVNEAFEEKTQLKSADLLYKYIHDINDQSFRLCLEELTENIKTKDDHIITQDLEFQGLPSTVVLKGVFGLRDVSYYLAVILPMEEGEEDE